MENALAAAPQLKALQAYEFDSTWRVTSHVHSDAHELLIVTSGRMGIRSPSAESVEDPGAVLIFPRDTAHEVWTIGPEPLCMYCIWWRDPARSTSAPMFRMQANQTLNRIEQGVSWLRETIARQEAGWSTAADGILLGVLHECGVAAALGENGDPRIERAKCFVREHLADPISLDELAESAQMSRSHFAHEFSRVTGRTPMQYLREMRIEAARKLLLSSRLPLKTIATLTGFRDAFELSRVYKRVSGHAPRQTRDARETFGTICNE